MTITIRAYANCNETYLVWQPTQRIPNCRGFAIYRRCNGKEEITDTWVGFQGDSAPPGTFKPSTEWPIQKLMWADYAALPGDTVQYRIVPMVGTKGSLQPANDQASDWSATVTVSASDGGPISAYFNRGIVATQWLARRLGGANVTSAQQQQTLAHIITTANDPTRNFLAGELRLAMLKLLSDAVGSGVTVYTALFELDDPELLPALIKLGPRANVILANGATKQAGEDENAVARAALRQGQVNVFDRMLPTGQLGHNKFLVICDAANKPQMAWTGSTNWTKTGLCTQANNGLLVNDPGVAAFYKTEWDLLKVAGNASPTSLVAANSQKKTMQVAGRPVTVWNTPVQSTVDLADANALINGAQQGILFLMFNPGPSGTLLNTIVDRADHASPTYNANLYTHGVLNQDPSTTAHPIVGLFHRGQYTPADFDVVLPEAVTQQMAYWQQEIKKLQNAWAMVHSKVIVVDPFGVHPVVMTGSHNMGPKASGSNDDNLIIVENDSQLAAAYAINIMSIFNQYRWRYLQARQTQAASGSRGLAAQPITEADIDLADGLETAPTAALTRVVAVVPASDNTAATSVPPDHVFGEWLGLQDNDAWQDVYFAGPKQRELKFWLGQG